MRVICTGASGFIGSHIAARLLAEGHQVHVIDALKIRKADGEALNLTPQGATLAVRDIRDITELKDYEAVVHCAARADISRNWDSRGQRDLLLSVNVGGTVNILEAFIQSPVAKRFVFLSTCGIYDDCSYGSEGTKTPITSPYSASKLAGEAYLESYAHACRFQWYALRLTCAVGSGYHHGHIADFVRMAQTGDGVIHAKNDGLTEKSFVHVEDIAAAAARMLRENDVLVPSGVYNVTADTWSWRKTLRTMGEMVGGTVPFQYAPQKHGWVGDPMAIVSGEKLEKWSRPMHRVEDGVKDALRSLGWGMP